MNHKKINKGEIQSFTSLFREIIGRLPNRLRNQFWFFFAAILFVAILETISTGSIALLASTLSDPENTMGSKFIVMAQRFLPIKLINTNKEIILLISCLVVFLLILKNTLQVILSYWSTRYSFTLDSFFGDKLYNGFLRMPYEWHLKHNSADIILAVQWRSYLGNGFINPSFQIMSDFLVVLFLLLIVIIVQPFIAMIIVFILGLSGFVMQKKVNLFLDKATENCREYDQSINRGITKGIHGIKDVKISGHISNFANDFLNDSYPLARHRGLQGFFRKVPVSLLETIGFLILAFIIYYMLFFVALSTTKIIGILALIGVATWRILPAINRILSGLVTIRSILPYTINVMQYLKEIELNVTDNQKMESQDQKKYIFANEILMKNVSFGYNDNESFILKDISFQVKKGQTLGIVGYSGAGKSTLADVLIGLLKPARGSIRIDGKILNDSRYADWMKHVGYVPQSPYIFDGTLSSNIAFGLEDSNIDRTLVLRCCKMANMQDFLNDLPEGIDTKIGERGVRLSGGQNQRVAIARALYSKPSVIIFDEATSSLDKRSEKAIQQTINDLKGKQTLIIIAHRLSTIKDCDLLVWLDKGEVKMVDEPKYVLKEYDIALQAG